MQYYVISTSFKQRMQKRNPKYEIQLFNVSNSLSGSLRVIIKPYLYYILNRQLNRADKSIVTLPFVNSWAAQRNLWRRLNKTILEHTQETCKRQRFGINLQFKWDSTEHLQKGLESWENRDKLQLSAQERFDKSSDRKSRWRWGSHRKKKLLLKLVSHWWVFSSSNVRSGCNREASNDNRWRSCWRRRKRPDRNYRRPASRRSSISKEKDTSRP